MSPAAMAEYRQAFEQAAVGFGWTLHEERVCHELDWDFSWTEKVWYNSLGWRLFAESELSEPMVKEIIHLGELLNQRKHPGDEVAVTALEL